LGRLEWKVSNGTITISNEVLNEKKALEAKIENIVLEDDEISNGEIIIAFLATQSSSSRTSQLAELEFTFKYNLESLSDEEYFDKTIPKFAPATNSVYLNGVEYKLHRIDFGETAGYE
jgi:hypothetical protein